MITVNDIWGTAYLIIPLLGGGVYHGLCIKYDWFSFLAHPIDRGRTFRGKLFFGQNKTYRGLVAMGIGSAIIFGIQAALLHEITQIRRVELFDYGAVNGWFLGFTVGTVAMLGELPNSFLKRQLGIAPGKVSRGVSAVFFYVLDQIDLLVAFWLVLALLVHIQLVHMGLSVIIVLVVHPLVTITGYYLGMRRSVR